MEGQDDFDNEDEHEPQEIRPEDVDGIGNGAELLDGFRSLLEHEFVGSDPSYVNWSDVAENLRPVDESLMTVFLDSLRSRDRIEKRAKEAI